MECCGKQRASKFCPDCGKPLVEAGPLDELLHYLRVSEKQYRTRATNLARIAKSTSREPPSREQQREVESHAKWAHEAEKIAARWGARADALEQLMGGGPVTEPYSSGVADTSGDL